MALYAKLALRNVFRNRRRTLIPLAAMGFGAAAIILFGGFVHSIYYGVRESTIRSQVGHIQIYRKGYSEKGNLAPFDYLIADYPALRDELRRLPHVKTVTARLGFSGLVSTGDTTTAFVGSGVVPEGELDLSALAVIVDATDNTARVRESLERLIRDRGLDLEIKTWEDLALRYHQVRELFGRIFAVLTLIVSIMVVFGITNTMTMAIFERTREIGTVMALGTRRRGVVSMFLLEGFVLGVLGAVALVLVSSARADEATDLVREADRARRPADSFVWKISITSQEAKKAPSVDGFEVFVKGGGRVFVKFVAPPRNVGRSLLALGRDLWIYLPDAGKPVRIPFSQRLVGQVANGDIARADYAGDYDATLAGEESVDGVACHVLDLKAKSKEVTYSAIKYWVSKEGRRPVKAEFYAATGTLLKTGLFDNFKDVGGHRLATRLTLTDAIRKDRSEEHTSELQSPCNLVCRLLLEKKKTAP